MNVLLAPVDWDSVFSLTLPLAEIIARGTVMYWFLFGLFRFVIRREVGAVGVSDILILVIVADAAQNGMAGESTSVGDAMVLVATLIGWNVLLDWLSFRYAFVRRMAQPRPLKLVERGRLLPRNMRREFISEEELWSKLRQRGISSLDQVQEAYMETDGQISVIKQAESARK